LFIFAEDRAHSISVGNARLLDGYAERDGKTLFEEREIEVRFMDNAGD
jgi:hypothetical protein